MDVNNKSEKKKLFSTWTWKIFLTEGFLLALIGTFKFYIFEKLSVVFGLAIFGLAILTFLLSMLWGVIFLIRNYKYYKKKAFLPLLLCLIGIFIVIFDPFSPFFINLNYLNNKTARELIIKEIKQNKYKSKIINERKSVIMLPIDKQNLSNGGRVIVNKRDRDIKVLFYTDRGISGNFSGFIYTEMSNDLSPKDFACEPIQTIKQAQHWYWVSCN